MRPLTGGSLGSRGRRHLGAAGLRILALASRLVLVVALARFLPAAEVGLYGVFLATVTFSVFLVGFDFYTYSTREIIRSPGATWRTILRSQSAFFLCTYGFFAPAALLLFAAGILPWRHFAVFFAVLALEHLSLEAERVLTAASRQGTASAAVFLRQAGPSLWIIPVMAFAPSMRTLDFVLWSWAGFAALGVTCSFAGVVRATRHADPGKTDWAWVRKGLRTCLPFLIATVCLRAMFTLDRQFLKLLEEPEVLGAYTLFASIGLGVSSLVHAGVHQFSYPALVRAAHHQDPVEMAHVVRAMAIRTAVVLLAVIPGTLAAIPLLLEIVGGEVYQSLDWVLLPILAATAVYNMSLVPHFVLYALQMDAAILSSTVTALVAFAVVLVAVHRWPLQAVLIAFGAASLVMLVQKTTQAARNRPDWTATA